jgi:hypothetical protein
MRPVQRKTQSAVLSLQHRRPSLSRQESSGTNHVVYSILHDIIYDIHDIVYDIVYDIVHDIEYDVRVLPRDFAQGLCPGHIGLYPGHITQHIVCDIVYDIVYDIIYDVLCCPPFLTAAVAGHFVPVPGCTVSFSNGAFGRLRSVD